MINGNLSQFLDTGWYSEAELFYNGYLYWCEDSYDDTKRLHTFIVDKWPAKTEDNKCYHSILNNEGKLDYVRAYEETAEDIELIKKHFLEADLFDGKSFWRVESEIAWLDEAEPVKEQ